MAWSECSNSRWRPTGTLHSDIRLFGLQRGKLYFFPALNNHSSTLFQICELQLSTPMTRVWENTQKTPYAHYSDQWISYDDQESLRLKTQYALDKGLGGVMIWSIETDDFRGICNQGRFPLLTAINQAWNGGSTSSPNTTQPQQQPTTPTTQRPTTTTTASSPGGSTPICNRWGNIRNPNNCATFYACIGIGHPYVVMNCGPGLYYNEKIDACDWPWAVAC